MRAGLARDYGEFHERQGHPPAWPVVAAQWVHIDAKPGGAQAGVIVPGTLTARCRWDEAIRPGQVLHARERWWIVDSAEDPYGNRRDTVMALRAVTGRAATYTPAEGDAYAVTAWIGQSNVWTGEVNRNDTRVRLGLLAVQLVWPWGRKGDTITLDGVIYTVDAVVEGGEDQHALTLWVRR